MAKSQLMKSSLKVTAAALLAVLMVLPVMPAQAFYSNQYDNASLELRGLLSGSGIILKNPDNILFYNSKNVSGAAVGGRLMLDAKVPGGLSFEAHAVADYAPLSLRTGGSRFARLVDVERSDLLDQSFDRGRSHLLIDRLNVQYASPRLSVKVGRQPINLAATFFFTPNDFFAPFAASTFFRSYKPGVDAARADIQLADLSQLSLIAVLGYHSSAVSDNGWSNRPDASRNGYVARASGVFGDFDLALLAGSVKKESVIGGDFQGELFDWLGVRGEGHVKWPDSPLLTRTMELALGLEHRWENSFSMRVEQFYHGRGAISAAAYNLISPASGLYMARHYSAAGASYEFTPLLTGDATAIYNWVDQSALMALYALYSLTDESELALSGTLTMGDKPAGSVIQSEFGLYGHSISVEYRAYF